MKFNVVCISMAIGLLASSIHAAPVVQSVEKVAQDTVASADGVKAPLDGTSRLTETVTSDVGVPQLKKRQQGDLVGELLHPEGLVGGTLGALKKRQEADGGLGSTVGGLTGTVGELLGSPLSKRLLDNKGDGSTGAAGGGSSGDDANLVGNLLGKRQDLGATVHGLTGGLGLDTTVDGLVGGVPLASKRALVDGALGAAEGATGGILRRRDGLTGGLTEPVTGTVGNLKLGQTVGDLADVNKLLTNVPVDTSSVTSLAGVKRSKKADKSNDDNEKTKDNDEKNKDGAKKANDADKANDDPENTEGDATKPKTEEDDNKAKDAAQPQEEADTTNTD